MFGAQPLDGKRAHEVVAAARLAYQLMLVSCNILLNYARYVSAFFAESLTVGHQLTHFFFTRYVIAHLLCDAREIIHLGQTCDVNGHTIICRTV